MGYEIRTIAGSQYLVELPEDPSPSHLTHVTKSLRKLTLEETSTTIQATRDKESLGVSVLRLPVGSHKEVIYKLMDSLLYESVRHQDDSFKKSLACRYRVIALEILWPEVKGNISNKAWVEKILLEKEAKYQRYFGDDLSDDSDNEDDEHLHQGNAAFKQIESLQKHQRFWGPTKRDALTEELTNLKKSIVSGRISRIVTICQRLLGIRDNLYGKRSEIEKSLYTTQLTSDQNQIMKNVNGWLATLREAGKVYSTEEIAAIDKQLREANLYVAQFRGINYMPDRWNAPSRRYHRGMQEVNYPQYCEMVLRTLDFCFYTQLSPETNYVKVPTLQESLSAFNDVVVKLLMELRDSGSCIDFTDRGKKQPYWFNNILERLQHSYSNGREAFMKEFAKLQRTNPDFWGQFPNVYNPFVSSGSTAYHALKYAYGMKDYYPYLMRPRWSGTTIEYSHVGKVYLTLHHASDLLLFKDRPSNVSQLDREARVCLQRDIGPEKETAFLSSIRGEDVVHHYVAKFPDFSGTWKPIYEIKYGLNKPLFYLFQFFFSQYQPTKKTPHTFQPLKKGILKEKAREDIRTAIIYLLSEWLCIYHENVLFHFALRALPTGGALIYLSRDGSLSEKPSKPIMRREGKNERGTNEQIHIHRELRRQIGSYLRTVNPSNRYGFRLVSDRTVQDSIRLLENTTVSSSLKKKQSSTKISKTPNYTPEKVARQKAVLRRWSTPQHRYVTQASSTFSASPLTRAVLRDDRYHDEYLEENKIAKKLFPTSEKKVAKKSFHELSDKVDKESELPDSRKRQVAFMRRAALQNLAVNFNVEGLQLQSVDGDGHCLYTAVSLYLGTSVTGLRREGAQKIREEIDTYRAVIPALSGRIGGRRRTVEEYLYAIEHTNEWADNLEIAILMQVYGRPIVILDSVDGHIKNTSDYQRYRDKEPIFIYHNGIHYDALILNRALERSGKAILADLTAKQEALKPHANIAGQKHGTDEFDGEVAVATERSIATYQQEEVKRKHSEETRAGLSIPHQIAEDIFFKAVQQYKETLTQKTFSQFQVDFGKMITLAHALVEKREKLIEENQYSEQEEIDKKHKLTEILADFSNSLMRRLQSNHDVLSKEYRKLAKIVDSLSDFLEGVSKKDKMKHLKSLIKPFYYSAMNNKLAAKGRKRGKAKDDGDCFFESIAKGLIQLGRKREDESDYTVTDLRQICADYIANLGAEDSWVMKFVKTKEKEGGETWEDYKQRVGLPFSSQDNPYPIWGRIELEGKILIEKLGIRIRQVSVEEGELSVTKTGYYEEDSVYYADKTGKILPDSFREEESSPMVEIFLYDGKHVEPIEKIDIHLSQKLAACHAISGEESHQPKQQQKLSPAALVAITREQSTRTTTSSDSGHTVSNPPSLDVEDTMLGVPSPLGSQ